MVDTELVGVISGIVEFLDTEATRSGAWVLVESPHPAIALRGDPDLLHQVFLNVLLNALHAVKEADPTRREVALPPRGRAG